MDRKEAADRLETRLKDNWILVPETQEIYALAISALREEKEPCDHTHNLEVLQKDDGIWLSFKSSEGQSALINWNAFCYKQGPIIGDACMQWAEDMLASSAIEKRENSGPCKKCAKLKSLLALADEATRAYMKRCAELRAEVNKLHELGSQWMDDINSLRERCGEWENAYDALFQELRLIPYPAACYFWRKLDPRRKKQDSHDLWKRAIKGWGL